MLQRSEALWLLFCERHLEGVADVFGPPVKTKNRILRAKAAADNSLETLGYFAAGVAAANAAGVDAGLVNALSFGILGLRTLATATYTVFQENRNAAPLRTVFWLSSQVGTAALFVLAGNTLAIWPN